MEILNLNELKSIEQFFKLKQHTLRQALTQYLQSKYEKVIATRDYVVAIGDIPVALVAHMDTVFKEPPSRIFYDQKKNVMWSPEGLGADDRAGVYSIIQIIKAGFRPSIIFTTDEEIGGIGASKLASDHPDALMKLKYIIELDRQGSTDCVFYDCDNEDFQKYVESFGFITDFGSFTDISVICPTWGVAGVNLSIGYYDEHSVSETLYIGQMQSTIRKVKNMLRDIENANNFVYIPAVYTFGDWYKKYGLDLSPAFDEEMLNQWDPSFGVSKEEWELLMQPQRPCSNCKHYFYGYELFPVNTESGPIELCPDCMASPDLDIKWCEKCSNPYLLKDSHPNSLCPECRKNKETFEKKENLS